MRAERVHESFWREEEGLHQMVGEEVVWCSVLQAGLELEQVSGGVVVLSRGVVVEDAVEHAAIAFFLEFGVVAR